VQGGKEIDRPQRTSEGIQGVAAISYSEIGF
jgi:hypothetical protein